MSESTAHGRQLLKEKICLTALRLFHKRGIRQVKMDDIATTLSVSKRTLYEIYTNKMELLAEVLELQNRMNHDRLKRELKPEANTMDVLILVLKISVEELNKISVEFLEDLHRYPEALQKLEELEKRSDEENRRFLQKGVEEGFFLPNINFQLMDDIVRIIKDRRSSISSMASRRCGRRSCASSCAVSARSRACRSSTPSSTKWRPRTERSRQSDNSISHIYISK